MQITEAQVRQALSGVAYPGFSRDIVSFGLVKGVAIEGADVTVKVSLATKDPKVPQQIYEQAKAALAAIPGIGKAELDFDIKDAPAGGAAAGSPIKQSIPGVKRVIAVASGKGGVGKSTVAANLAVALSATGNRVGLCDCDLYGPSVSLLFGTTERPNATEENAIIPVEAHGIRLMSMAFLLEDGSPVIVRGPMATRYTQQFLRQVAWGELDYLVLDLPPGTGDIQLTIVQTVALAGAVIVTTPQEMALIDARKAASMFTKVNVPILGVVENMSYFECPSDGVRYPIFGEGGGVREAARLGVPLLGQIPIDVPTRERGDAGNPVALEREGSGNPVSDAFHQIARSVAEAARQV
ncbi:iron-sulfur cluster carrier protein ApbC [soil metagenome]